MEYPKRSVNGNAGEYLVAYTVTKKLCWPCRLYGVDLGVDAELEVMGEDEASTGDIIKIQVKAVDSIKATESASIYVDDRHIDYWNRFCLPVIVCCVDLSAEKIYWKQITATEAFKSGGEPRKVTFCLEHDHLSASSKGALRSLVAPDASKNIAPLFEELRTKAASLPASNLYCADFDALAEMDAHCASVEEVLKKLEPLIVHFPWRISTMAHTEYNYIKTVLRNTRNEMGYCHAVLVNGG